MQSSIQWLERILIPIRRTLVWKPWLSLLLLGVLSSLAHAPIFWVWVLPITFGPALWLAAQRSSVLGSIWAIQLFALGHFSAGMYWLVLPLFFGPTYQLLGIPVSLFGIPGFLAVCIAFPVGITLFVVGHQNGHKLSWWNLILISMAWACGDWLRSWGLTGFPWNLTAYVWGWSLPMMQSVAWWGPFGLSFLTVFAAFSFSRIIEAPQKAPLTLLISSAIVTLLFIAGIARLTLIQPSEDQGVKIGLIQPAKKQSLRYNSFEVAEAVEDLLEMSVDADAADETSLDVVIWAEGSTGIELYRDPWVNHQVRNFTRDKEMTLITGSAKIIPDPAKGFDVTNTLSVFQNGELVAEHDKSHLVPFGEYMPLRRFFTLPNITLPGVDYVAGRGIKTISIPGVPEFSPLICYEVIFPGRVVDRSQRPRWMVNITTDDWFGDTSGPRQHLTSVRFRSVEEGLPIVRVAGGGISAVIDSQGKIVEKIALKRRGSFTKELPGIISTPTLYAKGGQLFGILLFWFFLFWLLGRFLVIIPNRIN